MINYDAFSRVMVRMQKYFGRTLEDQAVDVYWVSLRNFEIEDFEQAAVRIMAEFQPTAAQPFPLVRDFLRYCGKLESARAVNVVGAVRRAAEALGQYPSVDFMDRALHAVVERYDGWPAIVVNGTDEWWSLHERNFIKAYEAARMAGTNGSMYLAGTHEIENTKDGKAIEQPYVVCPISGRILQRPKPIGRIVLEKHKQIAGQQKQIIRRRTVRQLLTKPTEEKQ